MKVRHAVVLALAVIAIVIAWTYAATALRRTPEMGLPLDDSYIYLTYAKQIGRAQPFTYFAGSGYSAGATSIAWPMLLAPLWTFGARGHALVWAAFVLCAVLYAICAVLVAHIARQLVRTIGFAAEAVALAAGAIVVAIAPFAWTALSGMEVALASALLLALVALLARDEAGRPSRRVLACLVALSLARPEAALLGAAICFAMAIARRREGRVALVWLAPIAAPVLWLVANRVFAGHWMPSTALAKSQWFQPGFTAGAWASALATNAGKLVTGLFWDGSSPLPQARLFGLLWLVGAARIAWAARTRGASARVASALVVVGPAAWCALVLAGSGLWTLHQFRYIAPVFPLLAIPVAVAIAPVARWAWSGRVTLAASAVIVVGVVGFGFLRHRTSAVTYAQAVADTNAQVVKIGRYLHARLPNATVMLHDAGAIAYYGDGRIIDMLGLVTDDALGVAANGPGARFEYLEALPEAARPTHFAYYTNWLGAPDFLGPRVMDTPWGPQFARERVVAGSNMELVVASWDHVGTGERQLAPMPGWRIVDRVDVADLASERGHAWTGALGVRTFAEPTTTWSFVARDVTERGLVLDGGRTIRGAREAFSIARAPGVAARLVLRTGGAAGAGQPTLTTPARCTVIVDGTEVGELIAAPPSGRMVEVVIDLPPGTAASSRVEVRASAPYRALHWFVLERD